MEFALLMLFKFYNVQFCVLVTNICLILPHKPLNISFVSQVHTSVTAYLTSQVIRVSNLFRSNVIYHILCSLQLFSFKSQYLVLVFRHVRQWSFRYSCCTLMLFQIFALYTNAIFRYSCCTLMWFQISILYTNAASDINVVH